MKETEKCVHTEHCCFKHGCKYSYGDPEKEAQCPVANGTKAQSFPCEFCLEEEEEDLLTDDEW